MPLTIMTSLKAIERMMYTPCDNPISMVCSMVAISLRISRKATAPMVTILNMAFPRFTAVCLEKSTR